MRTDNLKNRPAASAGSQDLEQYLTFMLGAEELAIGILAIKEIIEFSSMTTVPMMPRAVRGVINLRGAVVPVMDLAARFGRAQTAITKRTCIVIVEVASDDGNQVVGVMVDAVNAVLDIPSEDIEPAPGFGPRIRSEFIKGMARVAERFIILLDVNRVLAMEEPDALADLGGEASSAATEAMEAITA